MDLNFFALLVLIVVALVLIAAVIDSIEDWRQARLQQQHIKASVLRARLELGARVDGRRAS